MALPMNAFTRWWRSLRGTRPDALPAPPSPAPTAADRLAQARALARDGDLTAASQIYWRIRPKHQTVEVLVEHAEILLDLGDHFGAASKAARARDLDPGNARAAAVQRRIVEREDSGRRPA